MTNLRKIGQLGENLAISFLKKKGYSILETNFYIRALGEIDIIASIANSLMFIEVKLSNTKSFDNPIYRVTEKKQKRIYATAEIYLSKQIKTYESYTFDVITLEKEKNSYNITHIENAFWG